MPHSGLRLTGLRRAPPVLDSGGLVAYNDRTPGGPAWGTVGSMRIGMDARLLYYQPAGIGLYTRRLLEGLEAADAGNDYVVLQSRKDRSRLARGARFSRRPLWTPPHHRSEQWSLPLELAPLGLDLLHSPDFIPPFRWRGRSVITVMDLAFLRFPHLLTGESRRYYGQVRQAVDAGRCHPGHLARAPGATWWTCCRRPPTKITVTHLAADADFRPVRDAARLAALRRKYGLDGDYLLFVGTHRAAQGPAHPAARLPADARQVHLDSSWPLPAGPAGSTSRSTIPRPSCVWATRCASSAACRPMTCPPSTAAPGLCAALPL